MSNIYDQFDEPEDAKKYQQNIYNQFDEDEDDEEKYTAQGLMMDRPKAAYGWLKAVPESAAQLMKDFLRFAADPKKVGMGAIDLAKQTGNKIGRNVAEVVQGQEMDVMPERQELVADTAWQGMKDRLGGGDELATTLMTDPVGLGVDASILKPFRGLDPMTMMSKGVDAAATGLSKKMYADAVNIPRNLDPQRRADLIDTGMNPDRRVTADMEGIQAINAAQKDIEKTLNEVVNVQGATDRFDVQVINSELDELMKSYEGTSGGNARIARVNQLKRQLQGEFIYRDTNGNPILDADDMPIPKNTISAQELSKYKKDAYTQVYDREVDPNSAVRAGAKTKTIKQQARAAKDELNRTYPELIDPNIKWGKYAQLRPIIERAMERFTELEPGMIPYISKAVRDPKWRSKLAISLRKAADGDITWKRELGSRDLRVALVMLGRNEQMIEEELMIQ